MPGYDGRWKQSLRRKLRAWFLKHARDLPWRRTRDPYHVWISEIMLQQTQVVTVIPYFQRFLLALPTIGDLAAAPERDVLRLWEGLGYYRRARQLHRAAQLIVERHAGEFPRDLDAVRALPGIGRYTAGAILSIAFAQRQPILEANTVRVLSRLLAYREATTTAAGQRVLWEAAEEFLPQREPGLFNQALMELGSEICTPREPACHLCPVVQLCPTFAQGLQAVIPAPKRQPRYEDRHEACVVIWRRGRVLLRRCDEGERWAGLWDFPRFVVESAAGKNRAAAVCSNVTRLAGIHISDVRSLATLKHGVTRFRITLHCYTAEFHAGDPRRQGWHWVVPQKLSEYPLSITGRRVAQQLSSC